MSSSTEEIYLDTRLPQYRRFSLRVSVSRTDMLTFPPGALPKALTCVGNRTVRLQPILRHARPVEGSAQHAFQCENCQLMFMTPDHEPAHRKAANAGVSSGLGAKVAALFQTTRSRRHFV